MDIETVKWDVSEEMQLLRNEKYEEKNGENYALIPEFWKIVCISVWYEKDNELVLKSFAWDEKDIIEQFNEIINSKTILVWHNIKQFDLPYIIKRWLIHWISPHPQINGMWKKPWEIVHIDTMEMRKSWWYLNTSLEIICNVLWLENPKAWEVNSENIEKFYSKPFTFILDLSEKEMIKKTKTFYKERREQIIKYCENDVKAVYWIYNKIINITNEKPEWATEEKALKGFS